MKNTKVWILVTVLLLAVCLAGWLLVLGGRAGSATAQIYQGGQLVRAIDLSQVGQPYSFSVDGPAGGNTIQVEQGRIRVSHAGCPDQVCVQQGWIADGVVPIVCLPNELVIQVGGDGAEGGLDGVSG